MAKHSKIDIGPSTENLPEWSISSEINTEELIKKEAAPHRISMAETALDSAEFVLDGTISSQGTASRPASDGSETGQFLDATSVSEVSPKEAQASVTAAAENNEAEEQLGYLANSLKDWEQSENALSEAAAMLLSISAGRAEDEKDDLQSLRQGLDNITASIHRMSASAREDMADVIEQTQRDNELLEAVQAEMAAVEHTDQMDVPNTVQIKTPDAPEGSESGVMDIDRILEQYHTTAPKMSEESVYREPDAAEQPAAPSRSVVMKTLAPLDESKTSGMNVNGIAELHKKPETRQVKETKKESERKTAKASKNESARKTAEASRKQSERKRVKAADHEFETYVIPEGEENSDGFRFVVDKGIVENPVEWRIDASFQSGGPEAEYMSASADDKEVFTVSGIEDQLKKQEVEAKRSRVEKSRLETSSGFAYALSDLK